jgi:uncharacterized protein YybS (DUF2232 family)
VGVTRKDLFGLVRAAFTTAVMFVAGAVIPVVGGLAMMFAPIPVLTYAVGYPRTLWRALAVLALALILIGAAAGPMAAGGYALSFGLATAIMCHMIERRYPFEPIVLCSTMAVVVAGTLMAFGLAGSPQALALSMHNDLLAAIQHGEKFYRALGIDASIAPETRAAIVDSALRLSPALAALTVAFMVLINLGLFWRISGRQQRVGYALFGDLVRWAAPEWLIWGLLVAGFGLFIPVRPLDTIALDCFVCVAAVYFCQGLAVMAFYFKVLAMPALARGLIYFVTVVQPVLASLVCAVGIFDLWIDFRRLKPPSEEARNLGDFL